ncbi:hypothetical protein SH2C18_42120 [Clostridium sediminicola]
MGTVTVFEFHVLWEDQWITLKGDLTVIIPLNIFRKNRFTRKIKNRISNIVLKKTNIQQLLLILITTIIIKLFERMVIWQKKKKVFGL